MIDPRGRDRAVYVISVAAELAGIHPQTLRIYDRRAWCSRPALVEEAGATAMPTSRNFAACTSSPARA